MMDQTEVHPQTGGSTRLTTADIIDRLSRFEGPPEQFLANLLAVQCQVGSAGGGAILRGSQDRPAEILAVYPPLPPGAAAPVWLAQAAEAFPEVLATGATAVKPIHMPGDLYGQPARRHLLLVPLRGGARSVRGLEAFVIETGDPGVLAAARDRLELTVSLLSLYEMRLLLQRRQMDLKRLRSAMETLASVNDQDRFAGLAMAFCNEVAARWQCERASVGFMKGRYVRLRAMSHTEKFSRRMKIVQDLEAAMEECLDQDIEVVVPSPAEATYVSRAAGELSRRHGPMSILSLPLRRGGKAVAVVTLERPADQPFVLEEVESLRLAADLCTARLINLEEQDRWFGARAVMGVRKAASLAVGSRHTWIKLAILAVLGLVGFMIFAKGDYRIEAPFVLEPVEQQVVPAPFEGFLKTVLVDPGDTVEGGKTVLGTLDTAELRLKAAADKAERVSYLKQAAAAERDGKLAEGQIARAQADRIAAQIDLVEYQITQATLISPLGGKVVSGDLKRQIGAPVKTGDVLFEVAPLEALRAELSVPEEDVADLLARQEGELMPLSQPGVRIHFVVERINPVAEVVDQKNVFKVRVRLDETQPWMKSGMEGLAKVSVGERRYAWIWTRRIISWIRMELWL